MTAAALFAAVFTPVAVASDPIDFQCITTNNSCSRTFSCPIFQRLKSAKAICNLEGITLAPSDLDATPNNTLRVMRASVPVAAGRCWIDATSVSQNSVTLPSPAFATTARQFNYGCSDIDDAEWGNGECQTIGKAICEPYSGELRIANIKTGTETFSGSDSRPLQGIARLQRTTAAGETEYLWLTTQSTSGSRPMPEDELRFTVTTNSGNYIRTLPPLKRNYPTIKRIGHGQSLFVYRNADESYTILTEAEGIPDSATLPTAFQLNGTRLLHLKLDKTLTTLSYVGEVALVSGTTELPLKAFSINKAGTQFRIAVVTMQTNHSTSYMDRKIRVINLDSSWLSTLASHGAVLLPPTPSHEFWLDNRIYAQNQGIVLMNNAVVSLAGNSSMPPASDPQNNCMNEILSPGTRFIPGTTETYSALKRIDYYTLDSTRAYGYTGTPTPFKRRCLTTDRADAVSRGGEMAPFEPEGLFAINDELYFSINYGQSPQRVKRIYRVSEQFFTSLP